MAYPGTFVAGQVLTAAEMNAINEGASARPLLTGGAYIDGTNGLVLSGLSGNYASTPDAAALDITGDIEIVVRASVADWTPSVTQSIIAKRTTADGLAWQLVLVNTGNFSWSMRTGGTDYFNNYTASTTPLVDGTMYWLKVTRTAATGVVTMEYAADSATEPTVWTTLSPSGTAVLGNLDTNNAEVQFGAERGTTCLNGTISRAIIRDGIGGTVALDADFEAEAADTLAFTEDSSNAATVSVTTTRYTYGIPGVQANDTSSTAISPNFDRWQVFQVTRSIEVDMFMFDVLTGPASDSTMYLGLYKATDDFQPTGAPVATASVVIPTSATGVFYAQITPVTLTPGAYVLGNNPTVQVSTRTIRGGVSAVVGTYGASPFVTVGFRSRTAATFPTGVGVMTNLNGSSANMIHPILLRWKAA